MPCFHLEPLAMLGPVKGHPAHRMQEHRRRRPSGLFALLLLAVLGACDQASRLSPERDPLELPELAGATPWTHSDVADSADDFHFVIVSDRTCCARAGVFAGAMPKINQMQPAFVVSVGDLIEGYTEDTDRLDYEWNEIQSFLSQLEAPFFYTPGNHDMSNAVMAEEWQQRFGPSYYHFLYKDVLFLVLNSELFGMVGSPDTPLPGPWQQADQLAFARSVLAQHSDARWTFVLVHQPLWAARSIDEGWLEIESLLGDRPYTVFAGHNHQYSHVERQDRHFVTLATTGGGSSLRGPAYGEFDHLTWVTMRDSGPVVSNLVLDGILELDVSNPALLKALAAIGDGITINTALSDESLFTSATAQVKLTNPTDAPLTLSPRVSRRTNFEIRGLTPVTLPPGEERTMSLKLTASAPTFYGDLVPAAIQWTATGTVADRPVQAPILKPLLPLSRHRIETANAVTIDGDLEEWGPLRFNVLRQGDLYVPELSSEDLSYRFDVRETGTHLLLAIDVTDDEVHSDAKRVPREQDAIALFIDPRDREARNRRMSAGEAAFNGDMAAQIATIVATGPSTEDELLGFVAQTNAKVEYQVIRTARGYSAEFAVPHSLIDERAGAQRWQEAMISFGVYDLDDDDHQPTPVYWRPSRYGNAALAESGLFRRSP